MYVSTHTLVYVPIKYVVFGTYARALVSMHMCIYPHEHIHTCIHKQELSVALENAKAQVVKLEQETRRLEEDLSALQANLKQVKEQHVTDTDAAKRTWHEEKKTLTQALREEQIARESERRALDLKYRQEMTCVASLVVCLCMCVEGLEAAMFAHAGHFDAYIHAYTRMMREDHTCIQTDYSYMNTCIRMRHTYQAYSNKYTNTLTNTYTRA